MTVAPSFHPGDSAPGSLQGQQLDAGDKGTYHQCMARREMTPIPTHGLKILWKRPETGGH